MRVCIIGCINYEYILVIVGVCCRALGREVLENLPFDINHFENLSPIVHRCKYILKITVTLSDPIRYHTYYDHTVT